ncbi:hypothetical protein [Saccharothrix sp. NRRL B-16348]|uniref:hypothetical protein n=1 Tax=Saccharothrix sp. NRRL B-16348 TaxID=1415542 RepID=UPI000AA280DE|nr:hypothetical protein [Saccharothrix sp. NRRL B-16348]
MRRTLGAALALVSAVSGVPAAAEPGYVELAPKGSAVAINDAGVVVGRATGLDRRSRAVRWDAEGRISELALPAGGQHATVFGVDADGAAYGNTNAPERWSQATRWNADGSITVLDVLPGGDYTFAVAVNESGTVVGYGGDADGKRQAIRWDRDGAATVLPGVGDATEATAIDDGGAIAGIAHTGDGRRAVRWDDDVLTDLGTVPGSTYLDVRAVNGRFVVGMYQTEDRTSFAVRWDGTASAYPPAVPGTFSSLNAVDADGAAFGRVGGAPVRWAEGVISMALPTGFTTGEVALVNDHGTAAGVATGSTYRPVRWSSSGEVTLLPVPAGTHGFAQGINDRGVVVGEFGGRAVLWP